MVTGIQRQSRERCRETLRVHEGRVRTRFPLRELHHDWRDPETRRIYKRESREYNRNQHRQLRYELAVRHNATPLAKQVMRNEFERKLWKQMKKRPTSADLERTLFYGVL